MKKVVIIPAGGSGRRLNACLAKQYLLLDGIPVLVHTLKAFQQASIIDEIILVVPGKDMHWVQEEIVKKYDLTKVTNVVAGGAERQDSVKNALTVIDRKCDVVIIHDGVRPFVTGKMIRDVIESALAGQSASVGVKAKDTIKEAEDNGIVTKTVPRQNIWMTQTPQAFPVDILQKAYKEAYSNKYYGTDDAALVERIGIKVKMFTGSYENIKITTPEDLTMAKALLKNKLGGEVRFYCGIGYDSHRFAEGRKLILGGVEILFDRGLDGHSDADVLVHAICDALLGAVGAGDIGRHFPDSDPAYENISSVILLERVRQIIEAKNMAVNNVDATVIMEKPKLAPYSDAMVKNIACALHISETAVNIKAKTNEGMGFVGRNEGVAVLATASLINEKKNDLQT
jgi:2-C-methyl-D-erythritol 4-phosphate cytidylyltransferase / 2-C-methyl-D-erythritol 2,4-cyclodiphosphate synthase